MQIGSKSLRRVFSYAIARIQDCAEFLRIQQRPDLVEYKPDAQASDQPETGRHSSLALRAGISIASILHLLKERHFGIPDLDSFGRFS